LLTEWLATVPTDAASVAWLSLDHRDNDPALFWTYVVTAMQTAVDGVGAVALQLLASASPATEAALAALLNELDGLSKDLRSSWTTTTSSRQAPSRTPGKRCRWPRRTTTSTEPQPARSPGPPRGPAGTCLLLTPPTPSPSQGWHAAGFLADVLGCCSALGDVRRAQGQLGDALRTYQKALDLAAREPGAEPVRGTADMHVGIAGVLLERNDLAAAAEHLAASRRLGKHNGLPQNPYRWRVVMARLREADGGPDAAMELLDEADRVYAGDYSPNVQPVPAVRARLRLRRGEQADADGWARDRGLSAGDDLSYLREYEHLTLARLLLARHHTERDNAALDDALSLFGRLQAAAENGGRGATVIESLVLQALAHHARGDAPAALGALHRAVTLAQPEGYMRLFTDEGPPMAALLTAVRKQADAPDMSAGWRPPRRGPRTAPPIRSRSSSR